MKWRGEETLLGASKRPRLLVAEASQYSRNKLRDRRDENQLAQVEKAPPPFTRPSR